MLTVLLVVIATFSALGLVGWAVVRSWRAQAEAQMWRERHREVVERESRAAWQANRDMIMY